MSVWKAILYIPNEVLRFLQKDRLWTSASFSSCVLDRAENQTIPLTTGRGLSSVVLSSLFDMITLHLGQILHAGILYLSTQTHTKYRI